MGAIKEIGYIVLRTLYRPKGVAIMLVSFILAFAILFSTSEFLILKQVVGGTFPVTLFLELLPSMFFQFLVGGGVGYLAHYFLTAILFSVYILLFFELVLIRRAFLLSSLPTSILGLVGISLGVTCISCGTLIGYVLLSILGSSVFVFISPLESHLFLLVGELLLGISIILLAYVHKRLH